MLTHGAEHQGVLAVPAIRVGVGGRRPRRTSQLALIRVPNMQGVYREDLSRDRGHTLVPSPTEGEGTRGDTAILACHFLVTSRSVLPQLS